MSDTSKFKPSAYSINLSNPQLDNAQFIMLMFMEKFKIKHSDPIELNSKSALSKVFADGLGISIGTLSTMFGEFEFYLNGLPKIYNYDGKMITSSEDFKLYLKGEKDMKDLHFETKSYIQVINHTYPNHYYGIFYSLGDAIKVCSENDLVKIGEITS